MINLSYRKSSQPFWFLNCFKMFNGENERERRPSKSHLRTGVRFAAVFFRLNKQTGIRFFSLHPLSKTETEHADSDGANPDLRSGLMSEYSCWLQGARSSPVSLAQHRNIYNTSAHWKSRFYLFMMESSFGLELLHPWLVGSQCMCEWISSDLMKLTWTPAHVLDM